MRGLLHLLLLLIGVANGVVHAASNDAFAAAEALLRHDAVTDHTYLRGNSKHPCFVSVAGADLPAEALARLRDTGLKFLPGSAWMPEEGKRVGHDMHVTISEPELLSDGTFRVNYSFYCGTLCRSTSTAILRRDASGWHVASTQLKTIS